MTDKKKHKVAVIDADSFAWIIGYTYQDATEGEVIARVDSFVSDVLETVDADSYLGFLDSEDGKSNRRDVLSSKVYKGNRSERPEWYLEWGPIINNRLRSHWNFKTSLSGLEVDDMVATFAHHLSANGHIPIICGVDKDLRQIPGHHYNYNKQVMDKVSPEDANYTHFLQVLTGDSTDNIPGLPRVGPKKAEKILENRANGVSLALNCLNEYIQVLGESEGIKQFYENYYCVTLHIIPLDGFSREQLDDLEPVPFTKGSHLEAQAKFASNRMTDEEVDEVDVDDDLFNISI